MLPILVAFLALALAEPVVQPAYFGIRVVDEDTKRGVPLIELRTVNDVSFYTDSAGWIAFHEPGLMEREVYFAVAGPGYEHAKDGFGFRGVRLTPKAGATAVVKVKRTNIAERMYRLTGQGIYRDSAFLGKETPVANLNAGVLGQDSVQVTPYKDGLFWLWGDTNLAHYPLGNYQTTAATSPAAGKPGCRGDTGIAFRYFTDPDHADRPRKMAPTKEPGAVWLFGLLTVPKDGKETLLAHYSRHKSLTEVAEHGLVRFDDEAGVFQKVKTLEAENTWRYPRGNALRGKDDYFYFAAPFLHTRVKATWDALLDPAQYEALVLDPEKGDYAWRRDAAPTTQVDEARLIRAGKLPSPKARYAVTDVTGAPVSIHGASIAWNEYRKKWLLLGVQTGGKGSPSLLGEVWYAEADSPTGPWSKAIKVASHPRYTFYNPRHHAFLDEDGGRVIYFEGTYTHTFSGNPTPTPRYDYNQLLYRLDLSDARLKALR
jgi:hypothetical protein